MQTVKESQEAEKQRQAPSSKSSDQNSLTLDVDHNLLVENNEEADTVSTEYMESFILSTSKEGWHAYDDEIVDLTEPRFESFCLTNSNSP